MRDKIFYSMLPNIFIKLFWWFWNRLVNAKNWIVLIIEGATKAYQKIIFVSTTKIGENTTNILNCYFSS